MWVMEIKYFEFNCKFYYFYEHLELKMILSTMFLDNLRPFKNRLKLIKKNNEESLKQIFGLTFNRMESYHPEHLLVNCKFFKNLFLWHM